MFRLREFLGVTAFFALGLLVLLVYLPGLNGPFLLDDFHNIHLSLLESWDFEYAVHLIASNTSGTLGRSVSMASIVFTGFFHGLDAWWFKYHNLLIHMLTGVGFFALGWRILLLVYSESRALWLSLFVVFLWALHPLFVSTVLYPVQRMAQLSTLWVVYVCLAYIYARTSNSEIIKAVLFWLLVPVGALLALFSKENGALLPFFLVLIEWFVSGRVGRGGRQDSLARIFVVLLPSLSAIVLVTLFWGQLTNYGPRDFTLIERLLTQAQVVWFYIGQLLLPRLSAMGLYLDYWPISRGLDYKVLLSLAGLGCTLFMVVWLRRLIPVFSFGVCWFFIGHLMESTFIPLEMVFEHRNYLPAWGLLLAVVSLLSLMANRYFRLCCILLMVFCLGFTYLTIERVGYWKSRESLAVISSVYHKDSFRAGMELASATVNAGHVALARDYTREAILVDPSKIGANIFLLISYCNDQDVPVGMLDSTLRAVESRELKVYGAMAMRTLMIKVANDRCAALSKRYVKKLVESVQPPQGVPKSTYFHLMAQVYAAHGDFARSSTYYKFAEGKVINLSLVTDVVGDYTRFGEHSMALNYLEKIKTDGRRRTSYEQRQIVEAIAILRAGDN